LEWTRTLNSIKLQSFLRWNHKSWIVWNSMDWWLLQNYTHFKKLKLNDIIFKSCKFIKLLWSIISATNQISVYFNKTNSYTLTWNSSTIQ
jgi:hypothetical protein